MTLKLIDESLFASVDPVALRGSTCSDCGTVVFPAQSTCPQCAGLSTDSVHLPVSGTIWSWTRQGFEPKKPYRAPAGGFKPFGVGYVDLGPVIVEGLLTGESWSIGDPVSLELIPAYVDDEGNDVMTYAFGRTDV